MVHRATTREARGRNKISLREEEYVVDEDEDEGESEDAEGDKTGRSQRRRISYEIGIAFGANVGNG